MIGIDHALATVASLRTLALDAVALVQTGSLGLSALPKAVGVLSDLYVVAKELSQALPELKDLDLQEGSQLTAALYSATRDILAAVSK